MMRRGRWRLPALLGGLALLLLPMAAAGLTNTIVMPPSLASLSTVQVTPDGLKPSECGPTTLTNLVTGPSPLNGSAVNDLVLGSAAGETIDGGDGDDCIVSGDGADVIDGGPGNDVCIATPAATFINCEVQIPPA